MFCEDNDTVQLADHNCNPDVHKTATFFNALFAKMEQVKIIQRTTTMMHYFTLSEVNPLQFGGVAQSRNKRIAIYHFFCSQKTPLKQYDILTKKQG